MAKSFCDEKQHKHTHRHKQTHTRKKRSIKYDGKSGGSDEFIQRLALPSHGRDERPGKAETKVHSMMKSGAETGCIICACMNGMGCGVGRGDGYYEL